MIRSLKAIRREARALSCETCPFIPGKPGPVEPFHPRCFGDSPEVWQTVESYFERAYRYDMGGVDGRSYSPADVADAVALAVWILWTTPRETWARLEIGWGDRMRALWAVRGRLRRMHWRDRFANHGGRRAQRRYRAYKASMGIAAPSPVAVAMAVERAATEGIVGAAHGRGRPKMERKMISPATAHAAIMGEPTREIVVGPVAVDGGVATIETDGQMREVEIGSVAFPFHTGERVNGRWIADGRVESLEEVETAYRMVPGRTRVEYQRTFVAEAVDAGTERDRHVPAPLPAPAPWSDEERGNVATLRETVRGQTVAANPEAYREALADYYRADRPLVSGDPRRARTLARWRLRALVNSRRAV